MMLWLSLLEEMIREFIFGSWLNLRLWLRWKLLTVVIKVGSSKKNLKCGIIVMMNNVQKPWADAKTSMKKKNNLRNRERHKQFYQEKKEIVQIGLRLVQRIIWRIKKFTKWLFQKTKLEYIWRKKKKSKRL